MIGFYSLSVLFSNSSKYPEVNCLDAFISYHGGTIHAYTELEFVSDSGDCKQLLSSFSLRQTVIVIEISSSRVVEALDILINSLVDPLMLSETVHDHIKIIDDESNIAQFDDHYRATRLLASLARRDHPIAQFSWGDKSRRNFYLINRKEPFRK